MTPDQMTPDQVVSIRADTGLSWLLERFVSEVVGAEHAVLVSRDGFRLAAAGLCDDAADLAASVVSGQYALSTSAAQILGRSGEGFRQTVIEHDSFLMFVMSTSTGPGTVSAVLAVLAASDGDAGVIAHEMTLLIKSVVEHLGTGIRRAPARAAAERLAVEWPAAGQSAGERSDGVQPGGER